MKWVRFLAHRAWGAAYRKKWVWYAPDSLEYCAYDHLRAAVIALDRIVEQKRIGPTGDEIKQLSTRGTR